MGERLIDEQVVVGVRAVALAAGVVLRGKVPAVGAVGQYQGQWRWLALAAERGRAWCVELVIPNAGQPARPTA